MPDNPNSYSDKLPANIAAQIALAREAVARSRETRKGGLSRVDHEA
jgi:hypothetical protein